MGTRGERVLVVYSSVLTTALAVVVLTGSASSRRPRFDELDVQRINVVEPDGKLRMVISDHARLPGVIVHGKEQPLDRPQAGMLFFNDEASEIGGLIFGGRKDAKGEVVDSGGSLSFDRYEANQVVQLIGVDDRDLRLAGLVVSDSSPNGEGHRRVFAGRGDDGAATIALNDGLGRPRLQFRVATDGSATITFLDQDGKVVDTMAPAVKH